jgi:hypothetical protein
MLALQDGSWLPAAENWDENNDQHHSTTGSSTINHGRAGSSK